MVHSQKDREKMCNSVNRLSLIYASLLASARKININRDSYLCGYHDVRPMLSELDHGSLNLLGDSLALWCERRIWFERVFWATIFLVQILGFYFSIDVIMFLSILVNLTSIAIIFTPEIFVNYPGIILSPIWVPFTLMLGLTELLPPQLSPALNYVKSVKRLEVFYGDNYFHMFNEWYLKPGWHDASSLAD